ncbi:MAG: hypothetical protein LBI18_02865 [Planctomycetaceae bacterium]|jgi:hypothetical protein|nr:hypothetical protein [Planctomycetaceae bacterium]
MKRIFLVYFILFWVGCNPAGLPTYPISGTVLYNNEFVPGGQIVFTPDSSKGNFGPQCIVSIVDGNYNSAPAGTIGGAMIVEISGVHDYKETDEGRLGKTFFSSHEERFEIPRKPFQKDFNVTGPPVKIVR